MHMYQNRHRMIKIGVSQEVIYKMGFLHSISDWKTQKYEEHRTYMKSIGKCPECSGRGFIPTFRAVYNAPPSCSECDGSGVFSTDYNLD